MILFSKNINSISSTSKSLLILIVLLVLFSSCRTEDPMEVLYGEKDTSIPYLNPELDTETRLKDLLSRMTTEEKAGQMVQGEMSTTYYDDVTKYYLGSVLSGGGTNPPSNSPEGWSEAIAKYQVAAAKTRLKIPIIYGIDAVHGNTHVVGGTGFPHHIGLGAANNDSLVYEMGKITASETLMLSINWSFAPCLALANDPRWGRTYESFSIEPDIVTRLGRAFTKGLMEGGVVGSAKHFVGDGGTEMGTGLEGLVDRGNTIMTMEEIRRDLLPPYQAQMDLGVQTVMPSYSSINGMKMHMNKDLIQGVLKGELGFEGFVISDWEAVSEIPTGEEGDFLITDKQVWIAVNAGVDMIMQPQSWKQVVEAIIKGAELGEIPEERLNDAVSRILRVKFESGLFDDPLMINNPGRGTELRSASARKVAAKLAEESLVLLKNNDGILPFKTGQKIYLAGEGANDVGLQCGGWTVNWQGNEDRSKKWTPGVTILDGLMKVQDDLGIEIITDSLKATEADIVLMVLSEIPYAEMHGDTRDLSIFGSHGHKKNRQTYEFVNALDKPVITILMAGRQQVDLVDYIDEWDAVVMAYLPGSEGGRGIARVLTGKKDFKGLLPMPWYKSVEDIKKDTIDLLFPVGYGLKYELVM